MLQACGHAPTHPTRHGGGSGSGSGPGSGGISGDGTPLLLAQDYTGLVAVKREMVVVVVVVTMVEVVTVMSIVIMHKMELPDLVAVEVAVVT